MSSQNKNSITIFFIFIISIILSILLARIGGAIHGHFWQSEGSWFIGPDNTGSIAQGFIYIYVFCLSLLSLLLLKQKSALIVYFSGSLIFWLYILLTIFTETIRFRQSENIGTLIIMLISSILGYLIALGIKKFVNYYQHKNNLPN